MSALTVTKEMRERQVARHFKSQTLIDWADRIEADIAERDAAVAEHQRWVAHLEAFIGPSALPTLRQSFAQGHAPGGAA